MSEVVEVNAAIFNDTSDSFHFGCSVVMRELYRRLTQQGMHPVWRHKVGEDWRCDRSAADSGAELVIVNGEGSIHHTAKRQRALALSEVGPFARDQLKVPSFLINSTIFEIDSHVADNLKKFTRIWVRDSASRVELERYGIPSDVVPDLSIGASFPEVRRRSGIGVTDSVLPAVTDALKDRALRESWAYKPIKWWRNGDAQLTSIPQPTEYATFLSAHELVLSGRYHAVALCVATKTPFIAIESNTPKISSLLTDIFGSCRRLVAPSALADINVAQFVGWTKEEEESLDHFLDLAGKRMASMMNEIRAAAN